MATIDTQQLWLALGTFYTDYFPDEERRYWDAYWQAFADISADLWGIAYQEDQTRSVFSTPATFERLNVLLNPVLQEELPSFELQLSDIRQQGGVMVVRGFVPREKLAFKAKDVPPRGIVRLGTDVVPYISVNLVTIPSGPLAGYVSEATFTLGAVPGNDYADSQVLSERFDMETVELAFRVAQFPGQTYIDATSAGVDLTVDATGKLMVGQTGFNAESFEYQSVVRTGDRYLFQLPTTSRTPGPGVPPELALPHAQGHRIVVSRLISGTGRWTPDLNGPIRIFGDGAAAVSIDNLPSGSAASMTLRDSRTVQANTDFDLEVTLLLGDGWRTPTIDGTRTAGFRVIVGEQPFDVAMRTSMSGTTVIETLVTNTPFGQQVRLLSERPQRVSLRIARTSNRIELMARTDSDAEFRTVSTAAVSGESATMVLFAEDDDTGVPSLFRFDEVIRRLGVAVGSQRLVSTFTASDAFPYRYTIDVNVSSSSQMQEEPKIRRQKLLTIAGIQSTGGDVVRCYGAGEDFYAAGIPPSGLLVIGDQRVVYDGVDRVDASTFDFFVRGGKLPPKLLPLGAGVDVEARTRTVPVSQFQFTGESGLWMRDPPTRGQLWVPLAQVDDRAIQKRYGPLVGMDAIKSTESYQRRVQGAWFALTQGPAIENVRIGVHLALGLPAALTAGVVTEIAVRRDPLGRVMARTLTVSGSKGAVVHNLNPKLGAIWNVGLGDSVEIFQPLTTGVEVLDVETDPNWGSRFGGTAPGEKSLERWNAFGILADISNLGDDASLEDAVRFALRIKPVTAKLFFSFTLGELGREEIAIEDDGSFTQVMLDVEDISFDEGSAPRPPQEPLLMDDGHHMDQGKVMDGNSVFSDFPIMSPFLFMDTGLTMDMEPRAWVGPPERDGHAQEELTATPVVEVEL